MVAIGYKCVRVDSGLGLPVVRLLVSVFRRNPRKSSMATQTPAAEVSVATALSPASSPSTASTSPERPRRARSGKLTASDEEDFKEEDETAEEEDDEDDEDYGSKKAPSPRVTRAKTRQSVDGNTSGTSSKQSNSNSRNSGGRRQRTTRQKGISSPPQEDKKKDNSKKATQNAEEADDDSPGDYVHVEPGDCVLLDSGDPENHFIALVSHVKPSQDRGGTFTAQWYYKPDDVREQVIALIDGGVLEREVFLSPHKDKNSMDAVIGLCNVVSPEEYDEVQSEIMRGFREPSKVPYYVCRYKYYPGRSIKKALEAVRHSDIRAGLGPQQPNVGEMFQAVIPDFVAPPPTAPKEGEKQVLPWKLGDNSTLGCKARRVWSPLVVPNQQHAFRQFRLLVETLRFAVGNVVKFYRQEPLPSGHLRCIVLEYVPSEHVRILLPTGQRLNVLKSELSSPLTEDLAMTAFYTSRFNLCTAANECSTEIMKTQPSERVAFKKEILAFAQAAKTAAASSGPDESHAPNKRRK